MPNVYSSFGMVSFACLKTYLDVVNSRFSVDWTAWNICGKKMRIDNGQNMHDFMQEYS